MHQVAYDLEIWLLHCQMAGFPYILRKQNQRYRLVGDCHIDGMRYGEGWDDDKCSEIVLM